MTLESCEKAFQKPIMGRGDVNACPDGLGHFFLSKQEYKIWKLTHSRFHNIFKPCAINVCHKVTKQDEPLFSEKSAILWKQRRDDHGSCQFDSWFSERISKSCHKLRELRSWDELSTKNQENLPTIRNPNSLHKYKSKYRSKISHGNVSPVDGPIRVTWQGFAFQVRIIMLPKMTVSRCPYFFCKSVLISSTPKFRRGWDQLRRLSPSGGQKSMARTQLGGNVYLLKIYVLV